jgi:hypothetical protein
MVNWPRDILIPILLLIALSVPRAAAQTSPQLSLTLVGQSSGQYVAPAGETTVLKMEILNAAPSAVYLLQGEAYLDPNLDGAWGQVHSEGMGNFHLGYLQSAIWTFDLPVPTKIQAANVTNGVPQVNLLIKIVYQSADGSQHVEQDAFPLGVPGATVHQQISAIWFMLAGVLGVVCISTAYGLRKRRRNR